MPAAERLLYASLLRLARRFERERVPLLGVLGTPLVCHGLDFKAAVRAEARRPGGLSFEDGIKLLPMLEMQLQTLLQAEEETREALAEWQALAGEFARRGVRAPFAAAAAGEAALGLLGQQSQRLADPLQLGTDPSEFGGVSASSGGSSPGAVEYDLDREPLSLEGLAAEVAQHAQRARSSSSSSSSTGGSSSTTSTSTSSINSSDSNSTAGGIAAGEGGSRQQQQEQQHQVQQQQQQQQQQQPGPAPRQQQQQRGLAETLSEVLYLQHGLRYEPFEWVYDGLRPLLLPDVLRLRKGCPLTLAVAAAGAGARAGLALLPLPAESSADVAASLEVPTERLREDVAMHFSGRGGGLAPPPTSWVLKVAGGGPAGALSPASSSRGQSSSSSSSSRSDHSVGGGSSVAGESSSSSKAGGDGALYLDASTGALMDAEGVRRKYPTAPLGVDWGERSVLALWQEAVRTVVQAHQRRGESDLVAHWIYVLLALDPQAPEWAHMLQASEVQPL